MNSLTGPKIQAQNLPLQALNFSTDPKIQAQNQPLQVMNSSTRAKIQAHNMPLQVINSSTTSMNFAGLLNELNMVESKIYSTKYF